MILVMPASREADIVHQLDRAGRDVELPLLFGVVGRAAYQHRGLRPISSIMPLIGSHSFFDLAEMIK